MKQGIDALRDLRYKLGPTSGPSYIYEDICQWCTIHPDWSQNLERIAIQYAIMQTVSQLLWKMPLWAIYKAKKKLQTS